MRFYSRTSTLFLKHICVPVLVGDGPKNVASILDDNHQSMWLVSWTVDNHQHATAANKFMIGEKPLAMSKVYGTASSSTCSKAIATTMTKVLLYHPKWAYRVCMQMQRVLELTITSILSQIYCSSVTICSSIWRPCFFSPASQSERVVVRNNRYMHYRPSVFSRRRSLCLCRSVACTGEQKPRSWSGIRLLTRL